MPSSWTFSVGPTPWTRANPRGSDEYSVSARVAAGMGRRLHELEHTETRPPFAFHIEWRERAFLEQHRGELGDRLVLSKKIQRRADDMANPVASQPLDEFVGRSDGSAMRPVIERIWPVRKDADGAAARVQKQHAVEARSDDVALLGLAAHMIEETLERRPVGHVGRTQ